MQPCRAARSCAATLGQCMAWTSAWMSGCCCLPLEMALCACGALRLALILLHTGVVTFTCECLIVLFGTRAVSGLRDRANLHATLSASWILYGIVNGWRGRPEGRRDAAA